MSAPSGASAIAFTMGALLLLVAILLAPSTIRVPVTVVTVLLALAAGLALTYAIGRMFGSAVG